MTYTRLVPLSIWTDPEFTTLSSDAQWLYFVLKTSPLGMKRFDPKAVIHLAKDMPIERILDAEVELRRTKYRLAFIPWRARPVIKRAVRRAIFARDGHRCVDCGATERLALDHIWPYSLGGTDDESNLRVLCVSCNSRKGARV